MMCLGSREWGTLLGSWMPELLSADGGFAACMRYVPGMRPSMLLCPELPCPMSPCAVPRSSSTRLSWRPRRWRWRAWRGSARRRATTCRWAGWTLLELCTIAAIVDWNLKTGPAVPKVCWHVVLWYALKLLGYLNAAAFLYISDCHHMFVVHHVDCEMQEAGSRATALAAEVVNLEAQLLQLKSNSLKLERQMEAKGEQVGVGGASGRAGPQGCEQVGLRAGAWVGIRVCTRRQCLESVVESVLKSSGSTKDGGGRVQQGCHAGKHNTNIRHTAHPVS